MNPIDLSSKVSGLYTFERVSKATGISTPIDAIGGNLLTSEFFRAALSSGVGLDYLQGLVLGTGNADPAITDTGLDSFLFGIRFPNNAPVSRVVNSTISPRYIKRSITVRVNGSSIANTPISEVGIALTPQQNTVPNSSSVLGSRALITDTMGSPTSIVILADEFLDVTYTLTSYAIEGVSGSFNINVLGNIESFDYEINPVYMNSTSQWSAPRSTNNGSYFNIPSFPGALSINTPEGPSVASTLSTFVDPSESGGIPNTAANLFTGYKTPPSWDAVSMQASGVLNLPLHMGNGGIRSIFLRMTGGGNGGNVLGTHQMLLDRPIPKTADRIFEFPITMSLSNASPPGV